LAEEFAASRCLVSEPMPNDAGFPLDERSGIVIRRTPEEIAEETCRLAQQPEEVRELTLRSRRTYVERIRPAERMRLLLRDVRRSLDSECGAAASASEENPVRPVES
jgi:hypothetical protein